MNQKWRVGFGDHMEERRGIAVKLIAFSYFICDQPGPLYGAVKVKMMD